MTFRGTVQNGKVVFDNGASPPEGTRVEVEPVAASGRGRVGGNKPATSRRPKNRGLLQLVELAVDGGPPDLAAQHDHYIYGTPKRRSTGKQPSKKAAKPAKKRSRSGGRS